MKGDEAEYPREAVQKAHDHGYRQRGEELLGWLNDLATDLRSAIDKIPPDDKSSRARFRMLAGRVEAEARHTNRGEAKP